MKVDYQLFAHCSGLGEGWRVGTKEEQKSDLKF